MLHTTDSADGCTLLITFDHLLGDATSLMFFIKAWSDIHKQMTGEAVKHNPEMTMPTTFSYPGAQCMLTTHPNAMHPKHAIVCNTGYDHETVHSCNTMQSTTHANPHPHNTMYLYDSRQNSVPIGARAERR